MTDLRQISMDILTNKRMKGQVAQGTQIVFPDQTLTIKNVMAGWILVDKEGVVVSGILPGAYDIDQFVQDRLGEV